MPSAIPYDPTLVLGNIVPQAKLDNLNQLSAVLAPADAAEDLLNSYIALKRSIDMTVQELMEMQIDVSDLITESNAVGDMVKQSAIDFAKAKLAAEKAAQPLKAKIQSVSDSIESPIDYNKSQIKQMPLSSDSLRMNCQYFSCDENAQQSGTHASTISAFVSDSLSEFGDTFSSQAKTSAQSQVTSQTSRHSIAGTLVISITCTHKDAVLLAPFIIDIDKAIRAWNKMFPDDMLKTNSVSSIAQAAAQAATKEEKSYTLLSGATYGSCFIGMVHVLNVSDTTSSETMTSIAESIQGQFQVGCWFADASGGFGVDSSFSNDAKNLLSSSKISSHCTLIALGSIPSIKSNLVLQSVQGFTDDDGAKSMAALQKLQNATADDFNSVDSSATAARTGQQMVSMQASKVNAVLSGLAPIDSNQNKMIDTNSMMDAMDDYIQKCIAGNIGVPINFYLKPITKGMLAEGWLNKYFPTKYNQVAIDDNGTNPPAGTGN